MEIDPAKSTAEHPAAMPLQALRTEDEYHTAVATLNQLLDAGAADELSPFAGQANSLGSLIGDYDDLHSRSQKVTPASTLRFLMQPHKLTQADLPEVRNDTAVSETLRGERELNVRQITVLAGRFHVPVGLWTSK